MEELEILNNQLRLNNAEIQRLEDELYEEGITPEERNLINEQLEDLRRSNNTINEQISVFELIRVNNAEMERLEDELLEEGISPEERGLILEQIETLRQNNNELIERARGFQLETMGRQTEATRTEQSETVQPESFERNYDALLEIYNEDLERLYELQERYENGEIAYSEYANYADYMVGRYRAILQEYNRTVNAVEPRFANMSDEQLEAGFQELEEEFREEYQFRAHQENGMEEHEDDTIERLTHEITSFRKEMERRSENPFWNLSDEELARRIEEFNKEYQFRAHQENGMEGHEDDDLIAVIDALQKERQNRLAKQGITQPDQPMMVIENNLETEEAVIEPETIDTSYEALLGMYNDDLARLYELQERYENGEIEYQEYERYADYMVGRYNFIIGEYNRLTTVVEPRFAEMSDEQIASRLQQLEDEFREEYQFRVHEENGMEEHEDDALNTLGQEILALRNEISRRKENPYWNLSDEELESRLADFYEEYQFRVHEENGMEGHEEDDDLITAISDLEKERRQREERRNIEKPDQPMMILEIDRGDIGPTPNPGPVPPTPGPVPPTPGPVPPTPGPIPPTPGPVPPPPPGPTPVGGTVKPDPKYPVVSGLQIYSRVINEVGRIKGTKAIKFHDIMEHVAIIGRPIAWITEKVTGRKGEINRIIEAMESIDFEKEFGMSTDAAMDLMLEDFLIKGRSPRNIVKVKANDIFLRALEKKLKDDLPKRIEAEEYETQRTAAQMKKLQEERENATPQRQIQIDRALADLSKANEDSRNEIERLTDNIEIVRDGRIKKSYSKKENIEGSDAALRDPDNREQITELARLEKEKLLAERDGKDTEAAIYAQRMNSYMDSQTLYKNAFIGKGKVSIGPFESSSAHAKVITNKDYVFMRVATGLGAALITSALVFAKQIDMLGDRLLGTDFRLTQKLQQLQGDINKQTQQLESMNAQVQDAQGTITDVHADQAVDSVYKGALDAQVTGERVASHAGEFNEASQAYIDADSANVQFATQQAQKAESYVNAHSGQGNPFTRFIDALRKRGDMAQDNAQLFADAEQSASAYISDPSNLISHSGGVDHTAVYGLESGMQVATNNADVQTLNVAADVLEKLQKINVSSAGKINITDYIDLSSLSAACKEQGIDLLSILAPTVLGANKAIDDANRNR